MSTKSVQDIFALVEKPSRYLGTESNTVRKDPNAVRLHIALAFPDMYEIGTSHFGLQILYHILNRHPAIAAERVFAPAPDMMAQLKEHRQPLCSLETRKPLKTFDIVGFSLLYELNYTNILAMLERAGIDFLARDRTDSDPFVIAGGPCTCNPEPVADLFDAMVIGDGESILLQMAEEWLQWKLAGNSVKKALLRRWSTLDGVYVPSFFRPDYDENGRQRLEPLLPDYSRVRRAVVADLDNAPFPDAPVVPYGKPVHDRLRLEVARGCTRGCRFCQAGMIYRPVRERSVQTVLATTRKALRATGYEDISLLSLSTGDYHCILPLMQTIMDHCAADHVSISLPSLRAGTLTPEIMELIKAVRKTGFTIAPEAGSQRLRDVINKNVEEAEILDTVQNAFDLGWQVIKLYFMVGLPTETDDDVAAIVQLVDKMARLRRKRGRRAQINVSVATFIPKAHTPFQWCPQISLDESNRKIQWLRDQLKRPGIQFKWQHPEVSRIEGLWARGDRRLVHLLIAAFKAGCIFDGWTDHFDYSRWMAACRQVGVAIADVTERKRTESEPLPWDVIDTGVSRTFLWQEWQHALQGERTPDCRLGDCNACGVCDFETLAPVVFQSCPRANDATTRPATRSNDGRQGQWFCIAFSKTGDARHFGHLEMAKLFLRAFRKAGIGLQYSEGFHPQPKLVFGDALPVGLESLKEELYLMTDGSGAAAELVDAVNPHLPPGIRLHGCRKAPAKAKRTGIALIAYRVQLDEGGFDAQAIQRFVDRESFIITRVNHKGRTQTFDLRVAVDRISRNSDGSLDIVFKTAQGATLRPADVLRHLFELSDRQIGKARVIKTDSRPLRAPAA